MHDYEEYEKQCEAIRASNMELLAIFKKDLTAAGLSDKTINSHLSNADFYINDYLLHEEVIPMEEGIAHLDTFLGEFFIRKCMWSTPATIKSTAASIKKFYKCMLSHNKIPKKHYDFLCSEIKTGMEQWQADCAQYNDPGAPNPFFFF